MVVYYVFSSSFIFYVNLYRVLRVRCFYDE